MNFVYTNAARALLAGEIDLDSGGDDIRVAILMTNTTADTERDVATIDAFSTLDEYDGSGYSRQALAGEGVAADNANDRGEFDATDVDFGALGAGARNAQALLVYKHVGADSANIPIAYIDSGTNLPFTGNGSNVSITWSAEGIIQATTT